MKRFACITLLLLAYGVVQAQTGTNALYEKSYRYVKTVANGTSAYSTGQCVGTLDSLDFRPGGEIGLLAPLGSWLFLQSVGLADSIKNDARIDWVLFNDRPTAVTDAAAWTPTYADLKKIVAVIPLGNTYYDGANNSFDDEPQVNRMLIAPTKGYLWYVLVIRATKTWSVASTVWLKPIFFR